LAAYEGLDRDVGLRIAEQSHKDLRRVPGDGYFYGELSWPAMYKLVGLVEPKAGDVFVDMGSGLGKMVLSTAMTRPFKECRGVEILPELHEKASVALAKLKGSLGDNAFSQLPTVQLIMSDMFAVDVSDADVVYCFATCLSREVLQGLTWKLEAELKRGARLIVISKVLDSVAFDSFGPGYISVEQAHSKWTLDAWLYVKK